MTVADRVELGVLTVCGAIIGLISVFYLNLLIGSVPVPITVVLAGVGNLLVLHRASQLTESSWRYAPMIVWALITLVAMVPGINGNGALIGDWRVLMLLLCGVGLPAVAQSMNRLNNL
ncbi:hypothetical protein nbrc107696_41900 [Gordonia spumicola]|uniref:Uncharacterized protein n=1 Tax=Gordonia spumicola TaxID=589161 RepID=A0A7I9VEK8_9ACTN|nr:hypothetical protein [Gordonia spumicola]GEE03744.1 hypothetical protein nbrc107696_41900 [Gordonia spumicola]